MSSSAILPIRRSAARPCGRWPLTDRWPWRCSTSMPPTLISARSFVPTVRPSSRRSPGPTPGPRRWRYLEAQEQAIAHRVARAGRPFRLGRQRPGDDPHDQERRPRACRPAGSDRRSVLPVPPLVRRDSPRQRAAPRLCTDGGRNDLGLVDGCFVITDVLSLAALQPEGAVASEAVRSEVKAAVREGAKTVGRDLVASGSDAAGKALARNRGRCRRSDKPRRKALRAVSQRLARWWSVRSAGGLYQVLRRLPEALPRLSLAQLTEMAGPLASKAGLRLSSWRAVRLLERRSRGRAAHPTRTWVEIRRRPGRPGRRRRGWISQDGRVSEESAVGRLDLSVFSCWLRIGAAS